MLSRRIGSVVKFEPIAEQKTQRHQARKKLLVTC
jgi:hypothetical protein